MRKCQPTWNGVPGLFNSIDALCSCILLRVDKKAAGTYFADSSVDIFSGNKLKKEISILMNLNFNFRLTSYWKGAA